MLLELGLAFIVLALVPYAVYLWGITWGNRPAPIQRSYITKTIPGVSIIISAYNEGAVIRERVANILSSQYSKRYYELIIVDDCSEDRTGELAREALQGSGIQFTIIRNETRIGTNRSYNKAIQIAKYNIIITTDADVFFKEDTIDLLVCRLISDDKIAAVCGDLQPRKDTTIPAEFESIYRNFYGRMCWWESKIDSTYCFNGAVVAFKKDLVQRIEDRKGADDANTAFESIRRGYHAFYELYASVYENIPDKLESQFRQKTRRAKRLIESTFSNTDLLLSERPFARMYLFRIWMFCWSPLLYFTGIIFFTIGSIQFDPWLVFGYPFLLYGIAQTSFVPAFTVNQFYLLAGMTQLGTDTRTWESTSKSAKKETCEPGCIFYERYDHGFGCKGWCQRWDEPIPTFDLVTNCPEKKLSYLNNP
jgi:biofilm PGA synthesis N-glycosyltransferase PgaC